MDESKHTEKETVLSINFVDAGFFVNRIHDFEKKYSMDWEQFMAQYSAGQLPGGCQNTDFAEWAFLCTSFMGELLKTLGAGPPGNEQTVEGQKPEAISGFLIFRRSSVRRGTILQERELCPMDKQTPDKPGRSKR